MMSTSDRELLELQRHRALLIDKRKQLLKEVNLVTAHLSDCNKAIADLMQLKFPLIEKSTASDATSPHTAPQSHSAT